MSLTDADIGEFQVLWKQHYGVDLSEPQAREYAERFLGLVELIVNPDLHFPQQDRPP